MFLIEIESIFSSPNAALYPATPSFVKEAYLSAAEMVAKDQTHLVIN